MLTIQAATTGHSCIAAAILRLSCTLYANDIFRTSKTKMTTYYAIGLTDQDVYTYTQCVGLTLSYNFNVSRSKYKGSGAGNDEKNRL